MVYDPAVDLFGNPVVKAAVTSLHVKDRNMAAGGCYGRQGRVRVAEDEDAFRAIGIQNIIDLAQDLPDLIAEAFRPDTEVDIRRSDLKVPNKDIAQAFVIILPGVDGDMFTMLVEHFKDQAKPNYLRPSAENRHYFHRFIDGSSGCQELADLAARIKKELAQTIKGKVEVF